MLLVYTISYNKNIINNNTEVDFTKDKSIII
jgi:hypothetical protein